MKDKELERLYQAAHYQANKALYKRRGAESRKRLRKERQSYVRQLKDSTPCTDCGIQYPYYVMQFDHVDGKEANIAQFVRSCSMKRLLLEIKKCEIVCANCHAERTHNRALLAERHTRRA